MFGGAKQAIESYLDWWDSAGYDLPVSDQRRDWLAGANNTPSPVPAPAHSAASVAQADAATALSKPSDTAPPVALPTTADAFDRWWLEGQDVPGLIAGAPRVPASGRADARLMLLTDCPDAADMSEGALFAGKSGQLLDAMLAAIGVSRADVRIAALLPSRPPGGLIDPGITSRLADIARHHVAIIRPKAMLIVGQHAMRAMAFAQSPPDQPQFNHNGVSVAVRGIHHPRLLLERPLLKRQAWEVLKQIRTFL